MDFEFNSQEELFKRVKPALEAKKVELNRLGVRNVKIEDIWNYLINVKWSSGRDLMLSDVVSDILHVDNKRFNSYLIVRKTRRGRSDKNERRKKQEKDKK